MGINLPDIKRSKKYEGLYVKADTAGYILYDLIMATVKEWIGQSYLDLYDSKGNRVIIHNLKMGARLEYAKKIQISQVTAGNNVLVFDCIPVVNRSIEIQLGGNTNVCIKNGSFQQSFIKATEGDIEIKKDFMFALNVDIHCNNYHYLYDVETALPSKRKSVVIGEHVWAGWGAKFIGGTTIGDGSIIGAQSVVAGKIPNNVTVAGNPAKILKKDVFLAITNKRDQITFDQLENTKYFDLPDKMQDVPEAYRQKTIDLPLKESKNMTKLTDKGENES